MMMTMVVAAMNHVHGSYHHPLVPCIQSEHSVPWCAMVTLEERLPPRLLTRVNFVVVDRRLTSSRFGRSLLRHWRAWLREVAEWGEVYCG